MDARTLVGAGLVSLTMVGVALGRYPGLRMNRATISLVGSCLLLVTGSMTLEQAYASLDMNTLVLLFSMMVLNVNLSVAGFFQLLAKRILQVASTPRQMVVLVVVASGLLSSLFLNDTVVLVFTPLVLEVCRQVRRDPIPYLVALATAANVGSTATIIGNPQNMLIGMASGIPFVRFTLAQAPVALVGLGVVAAVVMVVYRKRLGSTPFSVHADLPVWVYKPLLRKSLVAAGLMVVAMVLGFPLPLAALSAASVLLVTRRLKPERVFREIDWSLLVFFSGLFIVTGALETLGLAERLFALVGHLARHTGGLAWTSALLSNLISNVPAVLMFRPLVARFGGGFHPWLVLAMATTLAGNLTLLGSVANLIVAESARRRGARVSFVEYLKAGLPVTVITLAWGTAWFSWVVRPG